MTSYLYTAAGKIKAIERCAADRIDNPRSTLERRLALEISRLASDLRAELGELQSAVADDARALDSLRSFVSGEHAEDALRLGPRPMALRSPAMVERFAAEWRELLSLARVLDAAASE